MKSIKIKINNKNSCKAKNSNKYSIMLPGGKNLKDPYFM